MYKDLLDFFDIGLSQSQRLLILDIADTALVPHRLVGEERLSAPAFRRDRLPDWAELQV